ncbi:MAG: DUF1624 domain-containing protein [Vicinamibacterales bacterium]
MSPAIAARLPRLTSLDAWRGLIMVIMALDHVRDFIHAGAMTGSPEDLATTTPALFFTRWITHVCAPVFMFAAGAGAFMKVERGGSRAQLSWFLLTRGLWLVVLELTVMRLAMNFSLDMSYPLLLLVLWALGWSMVMMAALIHLPRQALMAISAILILGHNLFDGVRADTLGAWAPLWNVLHQQGVFFLGGVPVVTAYPLLPWVGVMAAGFCFGPVLLMEPAVRRRAMVTTGLVLCGAFLVLRTFNLYGDPSPWAFQPDWAMSVVSFLRATKYPPSLIFLLMTMGPALLVLAWMDRGSGNGAQGSGGAGRWLRPLVVIGRVPLFYYVVHFWLIHVVASLLALARYGSASLDWLFMPLPSMGGAAAVFPPGFGYSLPATYLVWAAVVLAMYPLCRWCAGLKAHRTGWWLGYL